MAGKGERCAEMVLVAVSSHAEPEEPFASSPPGPFLWRRPVCLPERSGGTRGMADLPQTWSRTLTVLRALMEGHEVTLGGYRVAVRETGEGMPALVALATVQSTGDQVVLGLGWGLEDLAERVEGMSEEDYVGLVGSRALTGA